MKKLIAAAILAAAAAGVASAETKTLTYASSMGEMEVVYDFATNKAEIPAFGMFVDFTYDAEKDELCSTSQMGERCTTFEEKLTEVGQTTTYTSSDGNTGTVTLTAVN